MLKSIVNKRRDMIGFYNSRKSSVLKEILVSKKEQVGSVDAHIVHTTHSVIPCVQYASLIQSVWIMPSVFW